MFLKFPLTTNCLKLNTHHKQIKKAELIRAEAIKQINKMADFSTLQSWGRIRRKKCIYANLGPVEDFYAARDEEKLHTA